MRSKKTEPIRIAQIMGKWVGGGVESVIMNYYKHIDRKKYQFDFICDSDSTCIPFEEIEKLGGKVIICPPYQHIFKYMKELKKIFKENKYQIVHSNINTMSMFPLLVAKISKVPIRIAHSHSTIINNKKEVIKNTAKNILKIFSKRYATDYMACSKEAGVSQFGEELFNTNQILQLNNAIDVDRFRFNEKKRKELRKKLGIKSNEIVIGHIGRLVTTKNHNLIIDTLYELCQSSNKYKLLIVGQGPLEKRLKKKISQLNINNKVIFTGQVNNPEDYHNIFDVFLFPSFYEGLGMVLIEAQCSGLPCITSTGVPSLVNQTKKVVFIDVKDPLKKWCESIKNVKFEDRTNSYKIFKNTIFDIESESKKLEEYYDERLKKIKILVCGMTSSCGGIESFMINYYRHINKHDIHYDFINIYDKEIFFQPELEMNNSIIYKVPSYYRHPLKYLKEVKKIIRRKHYDIIHCNMNSAVMIFPLIASKLARTKHIICHAHNSSSDMGKKKEILHSINKKAIPLLANHYFACSEKAGEWFFSKRIRTGDKYEIIYNAINTEKFKYDSDTRNEKREELRIKQDDFVIGHIGRFNKQKNHEFLIDIFKEISIENKNAILLLVGKGPLEETINKKVKQTGLDKKVLFLGQRKDVSELMSAMDIIVFPSIYEGLPLVGVEGQAAGLVLYVSDSITKEIKITDNVIFYPLNKSAKDWKKIIKTVKNDNVMDREKSFELVNASNYNIDVATKLLENIYKKMI